MSKSTKRVNFQFDSRDTLTEQQAIERGICDEFTSVPFGDRELRVPQIGYGPADDWEETRIRLPEPRQTFKSLEAQQIQELARIVDELRARVTVLENRHATSKPSSEPQEDS